MVKLFLSKRQVSSSKYLNFIESKIKNYIYFFSVNQIKEFEFVLYLIFRNL